MQRIRDCAVLISKWNIYVTSLPPRLKDHCRRWHRKIVRLRVIDTYEEIVFAGNEYSHTWTHSGCDCMLKTCTRWSQTKSQHGWDRGSPLTENLWTIVGCCWRENALSSGMWSLKGYPCSWRRWFYTYTHIGSTKGTQWV